MLDRFEICEAMDCNDLDIDWAVKPGWCFNALQFNFCGFRIHLIHSTYIRIFALRPMTEALEKGFADLGFKPYAVCYQVHCESDEDVYETFHRLQLLIWSQPMQLECGMSGFRGEAFAAHPTFLVRKGIRTGRIRFIDPDTGVWFLQTSPVVHEEFHSNGWALFVTESGTRYSLTL